MVFLKSLFSEVLAIIAIVLTIIGAEFTLIGMDLTLGENLIQVLNTFQMIGILCLIIGIPDLFRHFQQTLRSTRIYVFGTAIFGVITEIRKNL